ncbi:hypothetical protein GGI01_003185 [Coemansia sp. RSA 376]|nr:hypothetical protein IW146_002540 [Coemansia sp. RSA 922]KAJ2260142.1 hypothetical protein GGI01_003185 [Coemansia sp. RSA 376]KAJ2350961.1 hypothetical protein GGH92_002094 [Coemansia sp. RSA 2673]
MTNPTHNNGGVHNSPNYAQVRLILAIFGDILDVLEGTHRGKQDLRTRLGSLVYLISPSANITSASVDATVSALLDCLVISPPSGNGTAAVFPLRSHLSDAIESATQVAQAAAAKRAKYLAALARKRPRIEPQVVEIVEISSDEEEGDEPGATGPVSGTVAGSATATTPAPLPRLTWAQKGKGRAPPCDESAYPPPQMRHVIDLRVVDETVILSDEEGDEPRASTRASWEVLPDVGPSSMLGKFMPLSDGDHGDNADQNSAEENGPTTVIHDSSGQEVTSVRVSLVFGSYFYMTLAMFAAVYQRKFGNQLLPNGADSEVVQEALGALEGFRLYTIQAESASSDQAASLTVLMRDGLEFDTMRLDLQKRLGLTKRPISPIPAPLLFYSVAMLGCISLDQMSGAVLQEMLLTITGVDFDTLSVVTDQGIRQMSYGDIFSKTKTWVHDLCLFAIKGGHIDKTLSMAATCHRKYIRKGIPMLAWTRKVR